MQPHKVIQLVFHQELRERPIFNERLIDRAILRNFAVRDNISHGPSHCCVHSQGCGIIASGLFFIKCLFNQGFNVLELLEQRVFRICGRRGGCLCHGSWTLCKLIKGGCAFPNTLRFCRRVVCARREVLQLCAPKTVRCAKSYALHNLLPRFNIHAFVLVGLWCSSGRTRPNWGSQTHAPCPWPTNCHQASSRFMTTSTRRAAIASMTSPKLSFSTQNETSGDFSRGCAGAASCGTKSLAGSTHACRSTNAITRSGPWRTRMRSRHAPSTSPFWWREVSSSRSGSPALFPALWSTPQIHAADGLLPSGSQ